MMRRYGMDTAGTCLGCSRDMDFFIFLKGNGKLN